jgi:hypothetical protein
MTPRDPLSLDEIERLLRDARARLDRTRRLSGELGGGDGGGLGVREPRPPRLPRRDGAIALREPDEE